MARSMPTFVDTVQVRHRDISASFGRTDRSSSSGTKRGSNGCNRLASRPVADLRVASHKIRGVRAFTRRSICRQAWMASSKFPSAKCAVPSHAQPAESSGLRETARVSAAMASSNRADSISSPASSTRAA